MKKLLTASIIASTLLSVGTVHAEPVLLQHNNYGFS